MIGQIKTLQFTKWSQAEIYVEEYAEGKDTERHSIDIVFSTQDLIQLVEKLGLKRESDLVGMDISFSVDKNVDVYILIDLKAKYYEFGPNAKPRKCKGEIKGDLQDRKDGTIIIETQEDDKYVECHMNPAILWRLYEIFGEGKISHHAGFYSHKTHKGYIGYCLEKYASCTT